MKKNILFVFVLVLFSVLVSCNQEARNATGSLNIVFNNTVSKQIGPNISLKTSTYQVLLSGPNGEDEEIILGKEATETSKKDLAVGQWTVTVNALNPSGVVIGTGSAKVEVKVNDTANANVTVSEVSGEGTLTITLEGDNPNNSTYTLEVYKNEGGVDVLFKSQQFTLDDTGVLKAQVTLENNFYVIKIVSSTSTETCPAPETVRIVKGDSLTASFRIETNAIGNVVIAIKNAIIPNPSLKLYLSSSNLHPGDSVTVTAKGLEGDNYQYEWYLDRKKIDDQTTNILTIDKLELEGEYNVSCIVRDTASSLVWSDSKSFKVYNENYKPQNLKVSGEVEFYLASDVLVYTGTFFKIKDKQTGSIIINRCRSYVYNFTSETEICAELTNNNEYNDFDEYTYYFEEEYIAETNRTLVYVVVDKEIENYGYVTVDSGDVGFELNLNDQDYLGKCIINNKYIPYLPYHKSRTIKVETGSYNVNNYGYTMANMREGFVYPQFDKSQITVKEGETVGLTLKQDYIKVAFKNALFEADHMYEVWLLYNNELNWSANIDASNEVLNVIIGSNCYYDEIVIWDEKQESYCRLTRADLVDGEEIDVAFTPVSYVDLGVTIPSGRVKIEVDSNSLIPWDFSSIFWKMSDSSEISLRTGSFNIWTNEYRNSVETKLFYFNFFDKDYEISAKTSSETDSNGQYTLVTVSIREQCEAYGTLVVKYDISEVDVSDENNRTAVRLRNNSGDSYYILVSSVETKTLEVKQGVYSWYSCWRYVQDSSGLVYEPVTDPETFTVKNGETTTITIKLQPTNY